MKLSLKTTKKVSITPKVDFDKLNSVELKQEGKYRILLGSDSNHIYESDVEREWRNW